MPYYKHEDIEELMDIMYEKGRDRQLWEEREAHLAKLDARMGELRRGAEKHDKTHKDKLVEVFAVKGTENGGMESECYTQCRNGKWVRQSTSIARKYYMGVFRCIMNNQYSITYEETPEDLGALLFTIVELPSGIVVVEVSEHG